MSQSPEQRIYDRKPSAPTPPELRDSLELLLDTYAAQEKLIIQVNPSTRAFFNRFKVQGDDSARYNFGLEKKTRGKYTTIYVGGIDWFDPEKYLFATSSNTGTMTEKERRSAGGLILGAWEALANGERKPLTPSKR